MIEKVTGHNPWENFSRIEQEEFFKIMQHFRNYKKPYGPNVRSRVFREEFQILLCFIDKDLSTRSEKSMVVGVSFAGPYICTNTALLKNFTGRSKSSINLGLQQAGYIAVKKKQIQDRVLCICLPNLSNRKQWSVRAATDSSQYCFCSRFTSPLIPALDVSFLDNQQVADPIIPPPSPPHVDYSLDYDQEHQNDEMFDWL